MKPFFRIAESSINWEREPQDFNQTLIFRQKFGKSGVLKIMGNYTYDNSSMYYNNLDSMREDFLSLKNNDYFIVSSYKDIIGKDWIINSGIAYNADNEKMSLNSDKISNKKQAGELKLKLVKPINNKINIKFGGNLCLKDFSRNYIPVINDSDYNWKFNNQNYAAFAKSELNMEKRISARIGGRFETLPLPGETYISPRLSLAYKISKNSQVSLAYGRFSEQSPDEYILYNNSLKSEKAYHYIINYQLMVEDRMFRIEAYYKNYSKLVKYDSLYAVAPGAYNNNGTGYAQGIDIFFRDNKTIRNGDFWISYSLMDSKRNYKDFTFSHTPGFISKHNLALVYKQYIELTDSYLSLGCVDLGVPIAIEICG